MSERLFEFASAYAHQFWAIQLEGTSHTVRSGTVGSAGESVTKSFKTAAAASKNAEKLIATKISQGYIEQQSSKVLPSAERSVDLPPEAWLYNTYRPRPVFPPKPVPADNFDLEALIQKAKKCMGPSRDHLGDPDVTLNKHKFERGLGPRECLFWIHALRILTYIKPWDQHEADLRKINFDLQSAITPQFISMHLEYRQTKTRFYLYQFVSIEQIVCFLEGPLPSYLEIEDSEQDPSFPTFFISSILPYLSEEQAERCRKAISRYIGQFTLSNYDPVEIAYIRIASHLAMHTEVQQTLEKIIRMGGLNTRYPSASELGAPFLAYGLASEAAVVSMFRETKMQLSSVEQIRGWLAHTEWRQLDLVTDAILKSGASNSSDFFKELERVKAPETAVEMLKIFTESKYPWGARNWLLAHPQYTIPGLLPIAGNTKNGKAAQGILRELRRKGYEAAISDAIEALPETSREKLRVLLEDDSKKYAELTAADMPADLQEALAAMPKPKHIDWLDFGALPSIIVDGKRLAEADVLKAVSAVKGLKELKTPVVFEALRKHATAQSLDAFAWGLFEAWQGYNMDPKEKWAFLVMGFLGGNASALKLTPIIREWPGEGKHQVAVTGLNVLAGIGTDTALMQLNGIAAKVKFAGIKKKAQEMMTIIAETRNLTKQELEDRIVPDLGLDARGGRDFDFGPRKFRVILDSNLTPVVRDGDGKERSDLPKPNSKDDTTLSTAASTEWKLLKKQLKEVIKIQNERLEQAMVTMRRWSLDEFEMFHVKHPLMTNFAKRLVWGGFDENGKLLRCFRVNEESEYTRADDQAVNLEGIAKVGIVHPLQLDAAERGAWGQLFGDYEIIPPFPQLGRSIHTLSDHDVSGKNITQFQGRKVPSPVLWGMMEKRGWERGSPYDHGVVVEFSKYFPAAGVTAVVEITPGIARGVLDMVGSDQTFEQIFFLKGEYVIEHYPSHQRDAFVTLSTISPIAISEVLMDLTQMTSKGT
ncbi:MAG: DUF4132 domain-containing protein [Fimbriiglobus sp.]